MCCDVCCWAVYMYVCGMQVYVCAVVCVYTYCQSMCIVRMCCAVCVCLFYMQCCICHSPSTELLGTVAMKVPFPACDLLKKRRIVLLVGWGL